MEYPRFSLPGVFLPPLPLPLPLTLTILPKFIILSHCYVCLQTMFLLLIIVCECQQHGVNALYTQDQREKTQTYMHGMHGIHVAHSVSFSRYMHGDVQEI